MGHSEAEDAGGLSPVKYDNVAVAHFTRRTLLFFNCFDYKSALSLPVGRLWRLRAGAAKGRLTPGGNPGIATTLGSHESSF